MRLLLSLFFILLLSLTACAGDPPECDLEDGAACTCEDDGPTGILRCNDDGSADCICDEQSSDTNDTNDSDAGGNTNDTSDDD